MPQEIALDDLDLGGIIRPGEQIVWGQGAGEPAALVEKLLEQRHRLGPVEVFLAGVRSRRLLKPDDAGAYSFGLANDFQQAAMARARVVIAEVNDQMPWTYCDGEPDLSRIDY